MATRGGGGKRVKGKFDVLVMWWWRRLFPRMRGLLGEIWRIIPRLRFHLFIIFFKWRSARAHQFHPLSQDQSTAAQKADTTVADRPLTSCVWVRFPVRFPHYAWTAYAAHSDFVGLSIYACLSVTCHLHFWQYDRCLFRTAAVKRMLNRHRIRVSTQS